jgi:hypothetical protein
MAGRLQSRRRSHHDFEFGDEAVVVEVHEVDSLQFGRNGTGSSEYL